MLHCHRKLRLNYFRVGKLFSRGALETSNNTDMHRDGK